MRTIIPALSALCILAGLSVAHAAEPQGLTNKPNQTDSAMTGETRRIQLNVSNNILQAARAMPERLYNKRTGNTGPSFAELVKNVARSEAMLCGNINGISAAKKPEAMTKADLVAYIEQTSVQCHVSFAELSAENASQVVKTSAGDITHIAALVRVTMEESEGYGQMKAHFALNNVRLPDSADAIGKKGLAPQTPDKAS